MAMDNSRLKGLIKTFTMKKVFLIGIQFCLLITLKAQSLDETKSWILSKLNRYKRDFYLGENDCRSHITLYNYSFKFSNDTIIVTYQNRVSFPKCYSGDTTKTKSNVSKTMISKIPISDIAEVQTNNDDLNGALIISTKYETIRVIRKFDSMSDVIFSNSVSIGANLKTEENLPERLQKAFEHLISFYPKQEKKEAF